MGIYTIQHQKVRFHRTYGYLSRLGSTGRHRGVPPFLTIGNPELSRGCSFVMKSDVPPPGLALVGRSHAVLWRQPAGPVEAECIR